MSQHPLDEMRAKLDRADESLRTFDDELRRFTHDKPLRVRIDVDFKAGWNTAYIEHAEPVPPRFGVLVGESLYHGRSVLEHLVWALVKANHKKPGKDHTFPIREDEPRLKGARDAADAFIKLTKRKELAGVPMAAITLIERLQPYTTPDPARDFLAVLHRMAREDRHHAPHGSLVGGQSTDMERIFVPRRGCRIIEFHNLLPDQKRLVRGTKLARFKVTPLTRNNQVSVKGEIPVLIAFGDRRTFFVPAADFKKINASLRNLINAFQKFL